MYTLSDFRDEVEGEDFGGEFAGEPDEALVPVQAEESRRHRGKFDLIHLKKNWTIKLYKFSPHGKYLSTG